MLKTCDSSHPQFSRHVSRPVCVKCHLLYCCVQGRQTCTARWGPGSPTRSWAQYWCAHRATFGFPSAAPSCESHAVCGSCFPRLGSRSLAQPDPGCLLCKSLQGRSAKIDKRHLPDRQLPGGAEGGPYRSNYVPGWLGVSGVHEHAAVPTHCLTGTANN
jgi:hypothetical protein